MDYILLQQNQVESHTQKLIPQKADILMYINREVHPFEELIAFFIKRYYHQVFEIHSYHFPLAVITFIILRPPQYDTWIPYHTPLQCGKQENIKMTNL